MNIIFQEALLHLKLFFRERQAVFWGFVFPIFLLFLFCSVFGGSPERSTALVAGLLCINVMTGAFFGTGVITVGAREQGILRRYQVAPVARWQIIVGLLISRFISITLTSVLLIVLARLVYHILLPVHPVALGVVYAVGTLMFCAVAFVIASFASTVTAANGLAQILFMPMMFLSGATFPVEFMPAWIQRIAAVLPSTYYVDGLKNVMAAGGSLTDNGLNLLVMCAFAISGTIISARFFRWTCDS